ncbi:hypothetical protein NEUTE1DRAFT_35851 [Neurospora tetrasperma FGSC 2508]|uniref:Uncharacterized protein n=1 Tax=Neurospora tetrasperma (strain FGSC 2508 / ATCC MYA-4615 / P0657) TaxID=510951 RepID=F8MD70_NEUT8|nr:uncharacterized protein NEUTE1DRAFT_35851 [Neurospora tetrasperma FGSC 2508]EGO61415.1 hypothetical protein NEUTE1DRAFT_35851 [Neurospora tetrasperma FGSC 2508]EGZ74557.1 hypothetical protein NEUTE2DRAFT_55143 [Neurospora tetrasperma FGSC 2509]
MDESRIRYGVRISLGPVKVPGWLGRRSRSTSLLISPKIRDPSGEHQPGRAFYEDISVFVLHHVPIVTRGTAVISEMHEDGDGLLDGKVRKRSKQPASRAVTDGTSRR